MEKNQRDDLMEKQERLMSLLNTLFSKRQNRDQTAELIEDPAAPDAAGKIPTAEDKKNALPQGTPSSEPGQVPRIFTGEDKNKMLATNCSKMLADKLAQPMARSGNEGISFRYYKDDSPEGSEKDNRVVLKVDKDSKDEVTLQIGVSRRGTDRLYSNYLFEAGKTQEDVKAWLENADVCVPVILGSAKELSRKVDEYWD